MFIYNSKVNLEGASFHLCLLTSLRPQFIVIYVLSLFIRAHIFLNIFDSTRNISNFAFNADHKTSEF